MVSISATVSRRAAPCPANRALFVLWNSARFSNPWEIDVVGITRAVPLLRNHVQARYLSRAGRVDQGGTRLFCSDALIAGIRHRHRCRVHYCKATDNSFAVSENIFIRDFQLGFDTHVSTMRRTLRPKLLKSSPQLLTQAALPLRPVVPPMAVVEAQDALSAAGVPRSSAASLLIPGAEHPVDS